MCDKMISDVDKFHFNDKSIWSYSFFCCFFNHFMLSFHYKFNFACLQVRFVTDASAIQCKQILRCKFTLVQIFIIISINVI